MLDIILENTNGDQLTFGMNSPFKVIETQGFNPPEAFINTSEVALMDGALFNSAKLNMRTIIIAFAIEQDPPRNRLEIYKVLKTKKPVRVYYNGEQRQVYIDGYVQTLDLEYWNMTQIATVTILCPDPYLHGQDDTYSILGTVVSMFHWPAPDADVTPQILFGYYNQQSGFEIVNRGDVECGMVVTFHANGSVTAPRIVDYISGEYIGVNYTMAAGDEIIIDTRKGHKKATFRSNGVDTNIFNYILQGSTWLQLPPEGGVYTYTIDEGSVADLQVTFEHSTLYEGV